MLQTSSGVSAKWLSEMLNDVYYGGIDPYYLALKRAKYDSLDKSLFPPANTVISYSLSLHTVARSEESMTSSSLFLLQSMREALSFDEIMFI